MQESIVIASDHAGYDLKEIIEQYFTQKGFKVEDLGCNSLDSVNYPDYAHKLAEQVLTNHCRGVLVCGSGIGMSIAANRHRGIRAALCNSVEYAKLSRQHNDANVLVLGARFTDEKLAKDIIDAWIETKFEGGRHQTRVDGIEK